MSTIQDRHPAPQLPPRSAVPELIAELIDALRDATEELAALRGALARQR
jgi:hypothetical protein